MSDTMPQHMLGRMSEYMIERAMAENFTPATQPLSHSARVADAATQPLSHSDILPQSLPEWLSG